MENLNELREKLSDLEHEQWTYWSKSLWDELRGVRQTLDEAMDIHSAIRSIDARGEKWSKNWKPYSELDEATKDFDREWADKALEVFACFLETARKELKEEFCEHFCVNNCVNNKHLPCCKEATEQCCSCRKIDAVLGGERK